MEADPHEDPTAKGDRVAALMREYYDYETSRRLRWWQRKFDGAAADELMLGLMQIVMWEYRHDWPPVSEEGKLPMRWWQKNALCPGCREVRADINHLRDLIIERFETMSKELDDLTAQVKSNSDLLDSATTLINGIADRIAAAGVDPTKLAALTAELRSKDDALAAAVTANTPAATP